MMDMNRVMLLGRLGADPELKQTLNGRSHAKFPLATSRKFMRKDTDGKEVQVEETEWHHISVWGRHAEACAKYLRKGSTVYLEGPLRTRPYDSKQGGDKRWWTEVNADYVNFISPALRAVQPPPPVEEPTREHEQESLEQQAS